MLHNQHFTVVAQVDIVQTAINNGAFTNLVAALTSAGLVSTLKGSGPFTVFAPTDTAFGNLPAGTLTNLLKPENNQTLINVLKYHVIGQNLTAAYIISMKPPVSLQTLEGATVTVTQNGTNLQVNGANIITADVIATNGIIHVIDAVLMPPAISSSPTSIYLNRGLFAALAPAIFFSYFWFL